MMEGGDLSVRDAANLLAERRQSQTPDSAPEQPVEDVAAPVEQDAPVEEQPIEDSEDYEGVPEGDENGEASPVDEGEPEDSVEEQPEEPAAPLELEDDAVVRIGDEEVSVRELREGNLRQDDYTRKTQALKQQSQSLEKAEQILQARIQESYAPLQQAMAEFKQVPWTQLAQQDPERFQQLRTQAEAVELEFKRLQERDGELMQQIEQQKAEITRTKAQEAQAVLKRDIPGWNNASYYSLVDYAEEVGFDRDAVLQYTDPTVFKLLRKAKLYDEAKQAPRKKAVPAVPERNLKPGAPTPQKDPSRTAVARATKQARSTGTVDDAVALLRARRGNKT